MNFRFVVILLTSILFFSLITAMQIKTKNGHKILVAVAHGSEDIETISIIDTLRRADFNVVVGKVRGKEDSS